MSLPTWPQGSVRPSIQLTWLLESTTTGQNLCDATLTGIIIAGNTTRPITGELVITNGPNGAFRWDLSEEDVADSGNLQVQFVATFATGQSPAKSFRTDWFIEAALEVV